MYRIAGTGFSGPLRGIRKEKQPAICDCRSLHAVGCMRSCHTPGMLHIFFAGCPYNQHDPVFVHRTSMPPGDVRVAGYRFRDERSYVRDACCTIPVARDGISFFHAHSFHSMEAASSQAIALFGARFPVLHVLSLCSFASHSLLRGSDVLRSLSKHSGAGCSASGCNFRLYSTT